MVVDIVVEGGGTVQQITKQGAEAIFVRADVSKAADAQKIVEATIDKYGRLDILYNNAGIEGPRMSIRKLSEEDWDRVLDINLKGTFLCSKYAIPQMLNQGGGVIINTASISGLVGMPYIPAYCASKGGVILLSKSMALEYARENIRVNCICPGAVSTPLVERSIGVYEEEAEKMRKRVPMGRWARPEEIAQAALYLAFAQSSLITGTTLTIDGGWTAQ